MNIVFLSIDFEYGNDRKSFAQMALPLPFSGVLFAMLDRDFDPKKLGKKWEVVKEWGDDKKWFK